MAAVRSPTARDFDYLPVATYVETQHDFTLQRDGRELTAGGCSSLKHTTFIPPLFPTNHTSHTHECLPQPIVLRDMF